MQEDGSSNTSVSVSASGPSTTAKGSTETDNQKQSSSKAASEEGDGVQCTEISEILQAILARIPNTPKIFHILPRYTLAPVLSEWLEAKDLLKLYTAWPALQGNPVHGVIFKGKETPLKTEPGKIKHMEYCSEKDRKTLTADTKLQSLQEHITHPGTGQASVSR